MSFIILSNNGLKVAIQNENHNGVYKLRSPLDLEEVDRIKYLELPQGAKKIGSGREALGYFTDGLWRVKSPTEAQWAKARNGFSQRYEDCGYWLETWWIGRSIDGEEFPCRRSDFVSDY